MFEQNKNFSKLLGLSALLIAFSAAFFSVFGLSKLFAGAELSVIIMASSLEFGKLVAASFLYRYWDKINLLQKFYMTFATIVLIIITSAGIFGFLSNAYQGATVEFEKESTNLIFKEDRLKQLQEEMANINDALGKSIESPQQVGEYIPDLNPASNNGGFLGDAGRAEYVFYDNTQLDQRTIITQTHPEANAQN